jgi:hypothetical protein
LQSFAWKFYNFYGNKTALHLRRNVFMRKKIFYFPMLIFAIILSITVFAQKKTPPPPPPPPVKFHANIPKPVDPPPPPPAKINYIPRASELPPPPLPPTAPRSIVEI